MNMRRPGRSGQAVRATTSTSVVKGLAIAAALTMGLSLTSSSIVSADDAKASPKAADNQTHPVTAGGWCTLGAPWRIHARVVDVNGGVFARGSITIRNVAPNQRWSFHVVIVRTSKAGETATATYDQRRRSDGDGKVSIPWGAFPGWRHDVNFQATDLTESCGGKLRFRK